MNPSLFSLFKRGRYYRSVPVLGTEEAQEAPAIRKEAERFAVAAIAFCSAYDPQFRAHFFEAICRQKGDPPLGGFLISNLHRRG